MIAGYVISLAYKFCEACVDAYAETADEDYLWFAIDEEYLTEADKAPETKAKKEGLVSRIKGTAGAVADQFKSTKGKVFGGELYQDGDGNAQKTQSVVGKFKTGYNVGDPKSFTSRVKRGAQMAVRGMDKKDAAVIGGTAAVGVAGIAGAAVMANKILKAANNKPKSWIGKKIASLRSLYSKWLRRANMEKNLRRASAIKKVCATIMNVIDKLMSKLQNAAG